jgi:fumarylacetoacetate (FAA) hydrolase family protein
MFTDSFQRGTFLGRAWISAEKGSAGGGPCIIVVRDGHVFDATIHGPTCSAFLERADFRDRLAAIVNSEPFASFRQLLASSFEDPSTGSETRLLAPIDFQCIKAAGVTFVSSMLERVIEERAGGDPTKAAEVRGFIAEKVGRDISKIKPGSIEAEELKRILIDEGLWSQYLEVGIGPYAEIFTKAPIMSAVGYGAEIGVHPESNWNNPEPEVVLVVNSRSDVLGATLGNDVNLRDFEGRSALLLGKAKDNNASCAIGPLIRLFDKTFGIEQVRQIEVRLEIEGADGFHLEETSSMKKISRDVLELVEHAAGANHQYPDGFVLFTGTLFSPTQDRAEQGMGFTHKIGDQVTISSTELGALANRVNTSDKAAPWTFGVSALIENLRSRSLL